MIKAVWSTTAYLVGFDTQGSGCTPPTCEHPILSPVFFKSVGIKQGMKVSLEHQKAIALPRGEGKKKKKLHFFFPEAFKKNKSCSSILQNTLKQPNTELFMPVLKHRLYNPELIALGGEYI